MCSQISHLRNFLCQSSVSFWHFSRLTIKPTKWLCAPSEDSDQPGQADQSSLCIQWVAKDPMFLHADSEDTDQTGRMPSLICVFARCTSHFVGLSLGGSFPVSLVVFFLRKLWRSPDKTQPSVTVNCHAFDCGTIVWSFDVHDAFNSVVRPFLTFFLSV